MGGVGNHWSGDHLGSRRVEVAEDAALVLLSGLFDHLDVLLGGPQHGEQDLLHERSILLLTLGMILQVLHKHLLDIFDVEGDGHFLSFDIVQSPERVIFGTIAQGLSERNLLVYVEILRTAPTRSPPFELVQLLFLGYHHLLSTGSEL